MTYKKAILCTYDAAQKKDGLDTMSVQFNPETYSITGVGTVEPQSNSLGGSGNTFIFQKVKYNASTLSVELLFDSYLHGTATQSDVRDKFAMLHKCLEVSPDKHTSMELKFAWNAVIFIGALTILKENYTMFADDGTPVRARVSIEIKGCPISELTGKPNESPDRTKLRTISQGDTLWGLAKKEYGSVEQWRVIALANGIENPRKLEAATELILPALI